jgi:hypothetical protein
MESQKAILELWKDVDLRIPEEGSSHSFRTLSK